MPRFAILLHDHPFEHWDLFLESGSALRSWRILQPLAPGVSVGVEPTSDHRMLYLDYEGPISGGRGTVRRVDHGTFSWEQDSSNAVVVDLKGSTLTGRLMLTCIDGSWTARFETGS